MPSIEPSPEQFQRLASLEDDGGPIVMLNLLRYRSEAQYPEGSGLEPCTGREAYQRYGAIAFEKVGSVGGRILWMGTAWASVIAPDGEEWDDVVLVEYPSRAKFLEMVSMPDYQASVVHRTAALEDSRLVAMKQLAT